MLNSSSSRLAGLKFNKRTSGDPPEDRPVSPGAEARKWKKYDHRGEPIAIPQEGSRDMDDHYDSRGASNSWEGAGERRQRARKHDRSLTASARAHAEENAEPEERWVEGEGLQVVSSAGRRNADERRGGQAGKAKKGSTEDERKRRLLHDAPAPNFYGGARPAAVGRESHSGGAGRDTDRSHRKEVWQTVAGIEEGSRGTGVKRAPSFAIKKKSSIPEQKAKLFDESDRSRDRQRNVESRPDASSSGTTNTDAQMLREALDGVDQGALFEDFDPDEDDPQARIAAIDAEFPLRSKEERQSAANRSAAASAKVALPESLRGGLSKQDWQSSKDRHDAADGEARRKKKERQKVAQMTQKERLAYFEKLAQPKAQDAVNAVRIMEDTPSPQKPRPEAAESQVNIRDRMNAAFQRAGIDYDDEAEDRIARDKRDLEQEREKWSGVVPEALVKDEHEGAALCPFCDEPLPPRPSARLRTLIDYLVRRPHAKPRRTPMNPDGVFLPFSETVPCCSRHRDETVTIPEGEARGYPTEIDFTALPKRLKKLRQHFKDVASGLQWSSFLREAQETVEKRKGKKRLGMAEEMSTFAVEQPGYYGERGFEIIHSSLSRVIAPAGQAHLVDEDVLGRMEVDFFIRRVLVPEAALLLIAQDLDLEPTDQKVMDTLEESREYGAAVFTVDESELVESDEEDLQERKRIKKAKKAAARAAERAQRSSSDEPVEKPVVLKGKIRKQKAEEASSTAASSSGRQPKSMALWLKTAKKRSVSPDSRPMSKGKTSSQPIDLSPSPEKKRKNQRRDGEQKKRQSKEEKRGWQKSMRAIDLDGSDE